MSPRPAILLIFALATAARADVAADLTRGSAALTGSKLGPASAAFRHAFEAAEATQDQRQAAFEGLLQAEVAAGHLPNLAAYITTRLTDAPDDQRRLLLTAAVRCRWAKEGHGAGVAADLKAADKKKDYDHTRRLRTDVKNAMHYSARAVDRLAESFRGSAAKTWKKSAKPRKSSRSSGVRPIDVPAVQRPTYELRLERHKAPARHALRHIDRRLRITPPVISHKSSHRMDRVVKPKALSRKVSGLAARLFSRYYTLATQLAGEGRFDEAKDAYATILQLFPNTPQAGQAAKYAIRLFEKERGADHGAEALAGFLKWIREDVGVEQTDYAEYLAFQRFAGKGDPGVIAEEAEGFLRRHPDSKWASGIRLQLAVALDGQGKTDRAIAVLGPATATLDTEHHVRAALMLAWLHIFRGQADRAQPLLEAVSAQEVSAQGASQAVRLLAQIQARPPVAVKQQDAIGPEPQDEIVAERLLRAADRILAAGDADRAMDLYALYLSFGKDTPGYWEAKGRIDRLILTGRADEE